MQACKRVLEKSRTNGKSFPTANEYRTEVVQHEWKRIWVFPGVFPGRRTEKEPSEFGRSILSKSAVEVLHSDRVGSWLWLPSKGDGPIEIPRPKFPNRGGSQRSPDREAQSWRYRRTKPWFPLRRRPPAAHNETRPVRPAGSMHANGPATFPSVGKVPFWDVGSKKVRMTWIGLPLYKVRSPGGLLRSVAKKNQFPDRTLRKTILAPCSKHPPDPPHPDSRCRLRK